MKVKDLRLHFKVWHKLNTVQVFDHKDHNVFFIRWGKCYLRTKPQAIAIAKRLCDRFNSGQEKS